MRGIVTVPTYTAAIYVGFKHRDTSRVHDISEVEAICQAYCDDVGLCVTITPTTFYYTGGREPGAVVGLINYPRFPSDPVEIRRKALEIAESLREAHEQYAVSIVFPDETVMLKKEPA